MNNNQKNIKMGNISRTIIGLLLFFIGILVLWSNERHVFKTNETISEAQSQYIDVDSSKINSDNNDKLIATKGKLNLPLMGVTDSDFKVQIQSAKLMRKVEMYQWKESCDDDDGKEKCKYEKTWDDELISSNNFRNKAYQNPTEIPYSNKTFLAQDVTVGAYNLDDTLLNKLEANKKLTVYNNETTMNLGLRSNDEYYTNVKDNLPQIGDIRISYTYNDATNVSILAVQNKNTLTPFVSSNGYEIYEIKPGNLTGKEILQSLTDQNNAQKWVLRFIGTILIILGFTLVISPLQFIANFIPIFGTIFGWITSIASIILGLAISLIIIALSWILYRPVFAVLLLVIAAGIIFLTKKLKTQKAFLNQTKPNAENLPNKEVDTININNQPPLPNYPNIQNQNINNQMNYQSLDSSLNNINQTITPNESSSNIETIQANKIETLDLDNQDSVQNSVPNYSNTQSINNQINYQDIDYHLKNYTEPSTSNTNNSINNNVQNEEEIEVLDLDDPVQDITPNTFINSKSNINSNEGTKLE